MSETALIPVAQAELTVVNIPLIAVLLPDGQTGAVLSMLCKALDLRTRSQAQKLRTHPVLSLALVSAQIETAGGLQTVNILLSWGIPLWLASIRVGGRSPAYQEQLLVMQREVAAALSRQFYSKSSENTAASTFPEEPAETTVPPWQTLQTSLEKLEMALAADIQAVANRVTVLEAQAEEPPLTEHRHLALERLLAATIERLLEHERRLNRLKSPATQEKQRAPRSPDHHREQRPTR